MIYSVFIFLSLQFRGLKKRDIFSYQPDNAMAEK